MSKIRGRLFVKGQPKIPGSGRQKGTGNRAPNLRVVIDRFGTEPADLWLFEGALRRGLLARPPHSAPYLKLLADRVLGPVPKVPQDPTRRPLVIVLGHAIGHDPLAAGSQGATPGPIINMERATEQLRRIESRPGLPAAPPAPTPPAGERSPGAGLGDLDIV